MTTRFIGHLGLGVGGTGPKPARERYAPISYRLGTAAPTAPTVLVQRAILDTLAAEGPIDEVVIFVTPDVNKVWRLREGDVLGELLGRPYRPVVLPEQPREVVRTIRDVLDERRDGKLPERIVLDTTHGYRSLPLLTTAAITFALSEWKRQREPAPELQVLYGAYEQRVEPEGGPAVAPILDLTELVLATEWNAALDALERFGRGDDLTALLNREGNALRAEQLAAGEPRRDRLKALADRVQQFADGLVTARIPALLAKPTEKKPSLASELLGLLKGDGGQALVARNPLVAPALARLALRLEPLANGETLGSPGGVDRMLALAQWYLDLERPAEALATLREAASSALMVAYGLGAESDPHREKRFDRRLREQIIRDLRDRDVELSRRLVAARNSVQHAGFNQSHHPASFLRNEATELTRGLASLVKAWRASPPQRQPRRAFVNLTSHPSAGWDEAQRRAALERGDGVLVDVPFPAVPVDADEKALKALLKRTLAEVEEHHPAVVAVQGEHVLTHWLVRALEWRGVTCVAAVTPRESREQKQADGTVLKETSFRFSGWRSYAIEFEEEES